jgi:hypothetical protein
MPVQTRSVLLALVGVLAAAILLSSMLAALAGRSQTGARRRERFAFVSRRHGVENDPIWNDTGDAMIHDSCAVPVQGGRQGSHAVISKYQALRRNPFNTSGSPSCLMVSDGWGLVDSSCNPKVFSYTSPQWINPLEEDESVADLVTVSYDGTVPGPNKCVARFSPGLTFEQVEELDKKLYAAALDGQSRFEVASLMRERDELEQAQRGREEGTGGEVAGDVTADEDAPHLDHGTTTRPHDTFRGTMIGAAYSSTLTSELQPVMAAAQSLIDVVQQASCVRARPDVQAQVTMLMSEVQDGVSCEDVLRGFMQQMRDSTASASTATERAERTIIVDELEKLLTAVMDVICTGGKLDKSKVREAVMSVFNAFCPPLAQ